MNTSRTAAVAIYLLDHSRNVCGEQPNFVAIDTIAAQGDGCSLSCSSTIRTARSQTSGENLFVVGLVMAPSYLGVGASGKPGAVQFEHYNTVHPHRALRYRSPREFIASRSNRESMSGI